GRFHVTSSPVDSIERERILSHSFHRKKCSYLKSSLLFLFWWKFEILNLPSLIFTGRTDNSWGPRAIGDHGAPVSLPKLKKAYEKGTRGVS
ncbi:unnamed protein product, partial [Staurois parvus]